MERSVVGLRIAGVERSAPFDRAVVGAEGLLGTAA
jgi:hypothetical protein